MAKRFAFLATTFPPLAAATVLAYSDRKMGSAVRANQT